jgi:anaerobic magnesium-protoporphyrin IX monomethyl ester cyclase
MSDVLLGQSYYLRFDPKLWAAGQPYPPLGTLYAAALLRAEGHQVALFDAMLAHSEQEWEQALAQTRPRIAVLFEDNFNYLSKMCLLRMRQAALTMIAMARRQGARVLVCGSDASDHARLYLDAGAEFVLVGEGEATLVELMARLTGRTDTPFEAIAGLRFLDPTAPDGLRSSAPRPVLRDLDALPFPAWDLVDAARYRDTWRRRHGYYSINMVTTRGCPYHCNWCAKPIWGQVYNSRTPEHVVAELALVHRLLRPDHVWFADDIMGLRPGWFARFADLLEAQGLRTPFKCLSRADLLLRPGEIAALARAGASCVWMGAESGSQKILDAMEKGTRVEQLRAASAALHAAGVQVGFFLQFGYPGETREDIEATLALVRDCAPDEIGISVSYPLPGTRFHARVQHELGSKRNWIDSDDLDMMYRGPFTTAFYRRLYAVTHKRFRIQHARRTLRAWSQGRGSAGARPWKRLAALLYHGASLPWAHWQMERAARQPHEGLGALPPSLSHDEAARPTPQG